MYCVKGSSIRICNAPISTDLPFQKLDSKIEIWIFLRWRYATRGELAEKDAYKWKIISLATKLPFAISNYV